MAMTTEPHWKTRLQIERWIREFFYSLNYVETRTPLLVRSPGMEPHIRPIEVMPGVFLPTSPEFAMKKLLARGLPRIFQICSAFRDEPRSPEHSPEFTMLEFYETASSLEKFMVRVEELFSFLLHKLHPTSEFAAAGELVSSVKSPVRMEMQFLTPWPRFTVNELFIKHTGIDLRGCTNVNLAELCKRHGLPANAHENYDDLYFKVWLNLVEPKLPDNRLCFVTHYPVSQSSLCNRVKDSSGYEWANRFEVYAGRVELGNAFDELRDSRLQRENFLKDQQTRRAAYGDSYPVSPIDEEFLTAIERMPPACGIAIGLDRLAMVLLGAGTIDDVIPLASHWRKE